MTGHDDRAPGFGVYIHWPFCAAKCPYCDFNSHQADVIPQQAYVDALLDDLAEGFEDKIRARGAARLVPPPARSTSARSRRQSAKQDVNISER